MPDSETIADRNSNANIKYVVRKKGLSQTVYYYKRQYKGISDNTRSIKDVLVRVSKQEYNDSKRQEKIKKSLTSDSSVHTPYTSNSTQQPEERQCITKTSCGTLVKKDGFKFIELQPGSVMFRGLRQNTKKIITNKRPSYYADADIAMIYAGAKEQNCQVWKLIKPILLLNLTSKHNINRLLDDDNSSMSDIDKDALRILTGYGRKTFNGQQRMITNCSYGPKDKKDKNQLSVCTEGFYNDEYKKKDIYISLQVGIALGKMGIDGWYVPKNTIKRARYHPIDFHHEYLIVQAKKCLEQIKTDSCTSYIKDISDGDDDDSDDDN